MSSAPDFPTRSDQRRGTPTYYLQPEGPAKARALIASLAEQFGVTACRHRGWDSVELVTPAGGRVCFETDGEEVRVSFWGHREVNMFKHHKVSTFSAKTCGRAGIETMVPHRR